MIIVMWVLSNPIFVCTNCDSLVLGNVWWRLHWWIGYFAQHCDLRKILAIGLVRVCFIIVFMQNFRLSKLLAKYFKEAILLLPYLSVACVQGKQNRQIGT